MCRLQQVRSLWSDIPHIQKAVEKLTPECMDLLNKVFVVDDKKRITIDHIKEHPWYIFSTSPHNCQAKQLGFWQRSTHAGLTPELLPHMHSLSMVELYAARVVCCQLTDGGMHH